MPKSQKKKKLTVHMAENAQKSAENGAQSAEDPQKQRWRRLRELFGDEGALVVSDFLGEIAGEIAAAEAQATFQAEMAKILGKTGVSEFIALSSAFELGSDDVAQLLTTLRGQIIQMSAPLSEKSQTVLVPISGAIDRQITRLRATDRRHPAPEIPAVRCSSCHRVHALNALTYITVHGPITMGEAEDSPIFVTTEPVRVCNGECLDRLLTGVAEVARAYDLPPLDRRELVDRTVHGIAPKPARI